MDIGNRFGLLTVINKVASGKYSQARWRCRCDCGKEQIAYQSNLRRGTTRSCGCLRVKLLTKHGHNAAHRRSPEYRAWHHMIQRCENKNDKAYKDYGGRNITVHPPWHNFVNFLFDLKATIGLRPSSKLSLDRINNDGHYEPGNIRWATAQEQSNNQRKTIQVNGCYLSDFAQKHNLSYETVRVRYHKGERGTKLIRRVQGWSK